MERSPVNDLEIKAVLAEALTDDINNRELFMKGLIIVIILKDINCLRVRSYKVEYYEWFVWSLYRKMDAFCDH